MNHDSAVDLAKDAIVSTGSVAWVPAAFGYGVLDVAGETGGIMLATMFAVIGAYNLAERVGLTE